MEGEALLKSRLEPQQIGINWISEKSLPFWLIAQLAEAERRLSRWSAHQGPPCESQGRTWRLPTMAALLDRCQEAA